MILISTLLERFNERLEIDVNTNAGAVEIACQLLTYKQYMHSLGVAERARGVVKGLGLKSWYVNKAYQAGLMYNIGHADLLSLSLNHNVNGFYYLLINGWDPIIQEVALKHSYSYKYIINHQPLMKNIYLNAEQLLTMQPLRISLNEIITIADMTISADGTFIDLKAKKQEIADTYGYDSPNFKHFLLNEMELEKLEIKYLSN